MNGQALQTPVEYLKGVGATRAEVLKKELAVYTFDDLLKHFPFRHIDRTRFYKIKDFNDKIYKELSINDTVKNDLDNYLDPNIKLNKFINLLFEYCNENNTVPIGIPEPL